RPKAEVGTGSPKSLADLVYRTFSRLRVTAPEVGELAPVAYTLAGRLGTIGKAGGKSVLYFEEALAFPVYPYVDKIVCADWLAPANQSARVRLECLRGLYPNYRSPQVALGAVGMLGEMIVSPDTDRLRSLTYQIQLAQGPVELDSTALNLIQLCHLGQEAA